MSIGLRAWRSPWPRTPRARAAPESVQAPAEPVVSSPLADKSVIDENISPLDKAQIQEIVAIMGQKLIASLSEPIALFRQVAIALEQDELGRDLRYEGYMQYY